MNVIEESAPVWSCEAEQSVLGGLLLDPAAFDRVSDILRPGSFFDRRHGVVFATVAGLVAKNLPVDLLTVFEALRERGQAEDAGGLKYLNAMSQSVASAANIRRYADIVAERCQQRNLLAAADEAMSVAKGHGSQGEKLDRIQGTFSTLARAQVSGAPEAAAQVAMSRIDHYTALAEGRAQPGWMTHIPALDRMLHGLQPGWLYIVAARPSVGKSSFSQQLALTMAESGRPALMCSQEMSKAQCVDRAIANLGRVPYDALKTGKFGRDDWGRVAEAAEKLAAMSYHIDDQPALTLGDIRAKARLTKGLKMLVVDYLQLCSSTLQGSNRNNQIEEISRGLKSLAKELQIAVIALSQLNRVVETRAIKRPMLSDLRDSGAIEQDADVIVFLWPVSDFGPRKVIGCDVAKNREGACGEFALDFEGAYQRWSESAADLRPPVPPMKQRKEL